MLLSEMLLLGKQLTGMLPFLRTDFYIANNKIYFGEMTFYPEGATGRFTPDSFDKMFGDRVKLPI